MQSKLIGHYEFGRSITGNNCHIGKKVEFVHCYQILEFVLFFTNSNYNIIII